ncbi:protein N-terminal asparagine amidohydrolase [Ascaphus truei]|uniref:protein N-terminal asparagine amidohydrolase n=1 Tax=Ascaphus truei TaxID=8439 RepID=UPI003F5A6D41
MPLLIDSQRVNVTQSSAQLVQAFPCLRERAKVLTSQSTRTFGPKGFLYVQQRELAATTSNDRSIAILGSEDATTCHIVILRHTGNGATCLAHCDGSDTENEVADILYSVRSLTENIGEGRLELHLVGGFSDERRLSQKLSSQLLKTFDKQPDDIHLVTYCVSDLNDEEKSGIHRPIIYGIAINVKTAEIFKATFEDRGPDEDLRSAHILAGGRMINIYDAQTEQINIGPYSWSPFPNVDFWLEQEDERILEYLSTSPQAEPPHFVAHIRATLKFLKTHPHPGKSIFPDRKPRTYRKNVAGTWERVFPEKG